MTTTTRPPSATTTTATATATADPTASRAARLVARLAVTAPVALTAAVLLHPHDTADAGATLERIASDDRARWAAAHLLEPLAWLALAVVLALAARAGRPRGGRLIRVGAVLAAVGAAASALVVYSHGEAYLFMTEPGQDGAAMERLYSHYYDGLPLVGPLAILFRPGLLLLGIGLFRSRAVPRWAAAMVAVTPVVMLPLAQAAPSVAAMVIGVPLVAGLAGSARAIGEAATRPAR